MNPSPRLRATLAALLTAALLLPAPARADDPGSLEVVAQQVLGAAAMWIGGWTGRGVDVAVIDTGVTPVRGLDASGKLVHGPDLSFESQAPNLRHLDAHGHGTHVAGIIAGRESGADIRQGAQAFLGVAPGARVVSIKAGDARGAVDPSQIVAAIEWVIAHRRSDGLNIRVLNLSYGTDSTQSPVSDPIAHAVQTAWRKGIVVVTSAGNGGFGDAGLNAPATDPHVIAVGAVDSKLTWSSADDEVPAWSSRGLAQRHPDLVAPGRSIASLRVPGSEVDLAHPAGRLGERLMRASGTSQAAAFVSGAAALLIQQRPGIRPDELKALLARTAAPIAGVGEDAQGAGMLDLKAARNAPTQSGSTPAHPPSRGDGSLEAARGSAHVTLAGTRLEGERDIFGQPWRGAEWAAAASAEANWTGGSWNGAPWTGSTWAAPGRWAAAPWTAPTWTGAPWTALSADPHRWDGLRWDGLRWDGLRWDSGGWEGLRWDSRAWAGDMWSSVTWGG
jgi:subtilisin family serine protease